MSIAVHAVAILTLGFVFRSSDRSREATLVTPMEPAHMIWIPDSRPAKRGGGSRPRESKPSTVAQAVVLTPRPIPVIVEPPTIAREPESEPQVTEAIATSSDSVPDDGNSRRAGIGDGSTPGPGAGPDTGSGLGGVFDGVGNGVTLPIPLRRPPPTYTADAMRARLQGIVVLNCVVQPDGTCSDIRVVRSLDTVLGLDQQAIASARQWRFRPGSRLGTAVPVRVTLEIAFNIR